MSDEVVVNEPDRMSAMNSGTADMNSAISRIWRSNAQMAYSAMSESIEAGVCLGGSPYSHTYRSAVDIPGSGNYEVYATVEIGTRKRAD